MFDTSFTRSKDYFVAIQLLRIMDEWLDELLLSIDDLRGMPVWSRDRFGVDAAEDNIDAAIKGMKERATRFQTRVRKKSEEIKSLRDGVCSLLSYTPCITNVLNVPLIVVQRYIPSRGHQGNGIEPGHLCFHRCHRSLYPSQLPSGM